MRTFSKHVDATQFASDFGCQSGTRGSGHAVHAHINGYFFNGRRLERQHKAVCIKHVKKERKSTTVREENGLKQTT